MPYPFTIGGGTSHLRDLSRALIEEGHEVHIISAKPEHEDKELLKDEGAIVHNVGMRHKKFSGKLWKLPWEFLRRILFEKIFMISSYGLVKKIKPDVVHCQTALTEAFPFALMGKPFIITEHGVHTQGMEKLYEKRKNLVSGPGIAIYRAMEKFNTRRASKIICINEEAKEYYEKLSGKKCKVIGNGIFLEKKEIKPKKSRIYFTLSRLSEEKGLDYLLDALKILDSKGKRVEFWIAGDGEKNYVQSLERKAATLKNIKVKFLGAVAGKDKEKLLSECSVLIISSIFETFSISALEAMANNCAIIASDSEGPRKIIKPSFGALVPFSDEKKRASNLADAINKSLRWDIDKMGKNARKEVEKYDYRKIVKKYIQIYKDFIAKYGRK